MVDLGEEGAELWEKFEKFFEEGENTIINYASIYTKIQLKERINERISCNYNMHEYRYYRRIFSRLLKLEPCIYFTYIMNIINKKVKKDFKTYKYYGIIWWKFDL